MHEAAKMMPIISTDSFFSLSALLHYQLSAAPLNWGPVLSIMHPEPLSDAEAKLLIETMSYLGEAYGQKKRALGPYAILHPIRTASLLSRSSRSITTLDLLTTLLHDKNEDFTIDRYSSGDWSKLEQKYQSLIKKINSQENWFLNERIQFLTRDRNESYHEYLSGLINQAKATPELLRVKLADRLDNTLDLRMDLYEDTSMINCYQVIFEALFTETYIGPEIKNPHHIDRKINGAKRLYELFKSALFLSLLRAERIKLDKMSQRLFDSLAFASINEAQNIMLHIFTYHMRDPQKQRDLLSDVMNYSKKGGLHSITGISTHKLDGLFISTFDHKDKNQLTVKLDELYSDKELMVQAAVAYAVIFTNFLNDSQFRVEGISGDGIRPVKESLKED